jgi:hypothetical protein
MSAAFKDLRERLLRGGVAPRHVTRYLSELREHFDDLISKELSAGHSIETATRSALALLGPEKQLAEVMLARTRFRSWTHRAPWAVFMVAPLAALISVYLATQVLTVIIVELFGSGISHVPMQVPSWFSAFYSTVIDFNLYLLPLLCGWALSVLAIRQRMAPAWPIIGLSVVAVFCGLETFSVNWATAPNHLNSVGTSWAFLPGAPITAGLALQVLLDFVLGMVIYAICKMRQVRLDRELNGC